MRPLGPRPFGLGRRGVMLIVTAMLWAWVGTNIWLGGPIEHEGLIHTQWPLWFRLGEWYGAAVLGIIFAWREVDWPGWAAMMLPPLLRVCSYLWGWVVWVIPGGSSGYDLGMWTAVLYFFMMAVVANCAGWPDYPARTPRHVRERTKKRWRGRGDP